MSNQIREAPALQRGGEDDPVVIQLASKQDYKIREDNSKWPLNACDLPNNGGNLPHLTDAFCIQESGKYVLYLEFAGHPDNYVRFTSRQLLSQHQFRFRCVNALKEVFFWVGKGDYINFIAAVVNGCPVRHTSEPVVPLVQSRNSTFARAVS